MALNDAPAQTTTTFGAGLKVPQAAMRRSGSRVDEELRIAVADQGRVGPVAVPKDLDDVRDVFREGHQE